MSDGIVRASASSTALVDRAIAGAERIPLWAMWSAAFAGVVTVGLADFATGSELSLSIFYLLPVGLAAWRSDLRHAASMAMLAATVWLIADLARSDGYTHAAIPFWNAGVRFGFFVTVSVLLVRVRNSLASERERATIDQVTGIPNGRAFRAAIERETARAQRYHHPIAVGYIDLDDFKAINDRYGHSAGDDLLRAVAEALGRRFRATDMAARLGGDEFAVLLPESGAAAADAAFAKIAKELESVADPSGRPVRASVGVVVCVDPPVSGEELLREADAVMYRAKAAGGHRVLVEAATV